MKPHVPLRRRQQGIVLVVSLLMLLVLTMIGLAATRGTTLEQRMTSNQNDEAVAFEAAEEALRAGESTLNGAANLNYSGNTGGVYTQSTMTVNWKTINWDPNGGAVFKYSGIQPKPAVDPSYFIVYDPDQTAATQSPNLAADQAVTSAPIFYIYARGVGLSGNTTVILESIYKSSN